MNIETREDLLAMLNGKGAKIQELVNGITPIIHGQVARVLVAGPGGSLGADRIRHETMDYTQEIFLSLFEDEGKMLKKWEPEKGLSFKNFIRLLSKRMAISFIRTKKRNPFLESATEGSDLESYVNHLSKSGVNQIAMGQNSGSVESGLETRELFEKLLTKLKEDLSPLGYSLFEMLFLKEMDVTEVCSAADLSTDAVYAWRSRLMKTSKKAFASLVCWYFIIMLLGANLG